MPALQGHGHRSTASAGDDGAGVRARDGGLVSFSDYDPTTAHEDSMDPRSGPATGIVGAVLIIGTLACAGLSIFAAWPMDKASVIPAIVCALLLGMWWRGLPV